MTLLINDTEDTLLINDIDSLSLNFEISLDSVREILDKCYNYLQDNKGDTKPNACNSDGIPYHAYESGYHWQIHENSTTSECLTLMCRAMVEAGYLVYAKQLADFIIDVMTYDNIETIHWLVNLIDNGVEMDTDICGNYDGAVFSFVNGVALIPAGEQWHGEKVIPQIDSRYYGIRNCYSTDAVFAYRDLWIEPRSGTEYTIASSSLSLSHIILEDSEGLLFENGDAFITGISGTIVTLTDTSFTGNLQIYYGYRNGRILNKNELYRTYPLNVPCVTIIVPESLLINENYYLDINDSAETLLTLGGDVEAVYQISSATDGIQWGIVALRKLAMAILDTAYSDKADALLLKLRTDSVIKTDDYYIFDATNRGLSWYAVYTYDETGTRALEIVQQDRNHTRFTFEAGTGVVQWGIGNPFPWYSNDMLVGVRGDGSGVLRQIVINDGTDTFYYPWIDDTDSDKELVIKRSNFESTERIFLEASRIPYLTPYTVVTGDDTMSQYSIVPYSPNYLDSEGINYPLWHKWDFAVNWNNTIYYYLPAPKYAIFGSSHLSGVNTTVDSTIKIISKGENLFEAANYDGTRTYGKVNVNYKVIDANGTGCIGNRYLEFVEDFRESEILFTSDYFDTIPVHPIQNFELFKHYQYGGGTIYIAGIKIGSKKNPEGLLDYIAFETRQTISSRFDISYVKLEEGNNDAYPYSGVPVFSLEYSEMGLMGWRSGSYTGYTNPYAFTPGQNDAIWASKFIYDAQQQYRHNFTTSAPFYPNYLRNLGENLVYGSLETWTFNGADPNTTWAGFQYRALVNVCDHRFFNDGLISANEIGSCKGVAGAWANFLFNWIKTNGTLPSTYNSDGTILSDYESPDFYALVGRAMLLKYLIDFDTKSFFIVSWCYEKLITLQQANGSFKGTGQDTYGYHQAEVILFLAELYNYYEEYRYTTGMTEFIWTPKKVYTASIEFRTEIFESFSGKEVRTSETNLPIRRWRLKFDKDNSELGTIRTYVNSLKGRYSKFNWVWKTEYGGDNKTYSCRLAADNMVNSMQHLGYASFELIFETIDTNAYTNLTIFNETHNVQYEQQEQHQTILNPQIVANQAVNVQWESAKKRWNLQFDKNQTSRIWLENFFISQKGRYKEWDFTWSTSLGGDDQVYKVRFDVDVLDFEISYMGYGTFTIPIIEVI